MQWQMKGQTVCMRTGLSCRPIETRSIAKVLDIEEGKSCQHWAFGRMRLFNSHSVKCSHQVIELEVATERE